MPIFFLLLCLLVVPVVEGQPVQILRVDEAPEIDGTLSDSVWHRAHPVRSFTQLKPDEGRPATQQTEMYFLYDSRALYVGARMYDSAPDSIVAQLGRRDAQTVSDRVFVFFDPYLDRSNGYYFWVDAAGTVGEGTLFNDGWNDDSWDGVWEARVSRDSLGWSAEMRIPLSQLRYPDGVDRPWGVNAMRLLARRNEEAFLVAPRQNASGFVSIFPELHGIAGLKARRPMEMTPYVTSRAAHVPSLNGNPLTRPRSLRSEAGADFRVGVTSGLTLNVAVNPDFGQVEVDPAVVNLSDRETFFSEKRPFFVEGSQLFMFGSGGSGNNMSFNWSNPQLVYSRRIGRSPQLGTPGAEYADRPAHTRILGAAKMTGRVGTLQVGAMQAITQEMEAQTWLEGQQGRAVVEPATSYSTLRLLQEFKGGQRGLGVMSTFTSRRLGSDHARTALGEWASVTGVDGWTRFGPEGLFALTGWAAMSHLAGDAAWLARVQRSGVHYLQRPDRKRGHYDPTRTALTGFAGRMMLNKQRGNVMFNAALGAIDSYFNSNDLGFQSGGGGLINGHVFAGYQWNEPTGFARRQRVMGALAQSTDADGLSTSRFIWARYWVELPSYWNISAGGVYAPSNFNTRLTRGGPAVRRKHGYNANVNINSDSRKPLQAYLSGYSEWSEDYASLGINTSVDWRPSTFVNLSVGPFLELSRNNHQYITTRVDPTSPTFGHRYVFAQLDQHSLGTEVRLNWTLTPALSVQLFTQGLVASGAYSKWLELANPAKGTFNVYGRDAGRVDAVEQGIRIDPDDAGPAPSFTIGNPDFRFASLRANAVLRWEFRPGSTFFFVWTQMREDVEGEGQFAPRRAATRLIDTRPDQYLAVKLTYRLGQ